MTIAAVNAAQAEALVTRAPSLGYMRARVLPDGSVAALADLMFTRAIVLGVTEHSWGRRFCFNDRALAERRFDELETEDDEPAGYVARRG
jgi:hypothetical protein